MKLKLQFTASVSNPPPDARPLSRKPPHCHSYHATIRPSDMLKWVLTVCDLQVKTVRPAQRSGTCWTDTRPVWGALSPFPISNRLDRTS